jgi:hypothetical protein
MQLTLGRITGVLVEPRFLARDGHLSAYQASGIGSSHAEQFAGAILRTASCCEGLLPNTPSISNWTPAESPENTTRLFASNSILALVLHGFPRMTLSRSEFLFCRLGANNFFRCRIAPKCHYPLEFDWDPTRSWTRLARAGWARCTAPVTRF